MKYTKSSYRLLGAGLSIGGLTLALLSHFVLLLTPLTALGTSLIILAGVSFALATGAPKVPLELSEVVSQSGIKNMLAIFEKLDVKSKAVYLPSSMANGSPHTFVPFVSNLTFSQSEEVVLPEKFILKQADKPEEVGWLITTPGSIVAGKVTAKPDASERNAEAALSQVLFGALDLADGCRVRREADGFRVEVFNLRLEQNELMPHDCVGSHLASVLASVVAEVFDAPVVVETERYTRGKGAVELKLRGLSV